MKDTTMTQARWPIPATVFSGSVFLTVPDALPLTLATPDPRVTPRERCALRASALVAPELACLQGNVGDAKESIHGPRIPCPWTSIKGIGGCAYG
eukprot:scaffold130532_cov18-Tisochrysis_lutea.AAC.1